MVTRLCLVESEIGCVSEGVLLSKATSTYDLYKARAEGVPICVSREYRGGYDDVIIENDGGSAYQSLGYCIDFMRKRSMHSEF